MKRWMKSGGPGAPGEERRRGDRRRSGIRSAEAPRRPWLRAIWETGPADASYGLDFFALARWEGEGGLVD